MVDTFDCPNTNLKKGSKGEKVILLQTHLKTLGYYVKSRDGKTLIVDGDFGPETDKAVKAFQKATGHTQDGVFGPKTCPDLNKQILAKNGVTTTTSSGNSTSTSNNGSTSTDPYAIDTSKNILNSGNSNLHIAGIHFMVGNVTYDTPFNSGGWNSLELMNGKNFTYLKHDVPKKYTCDTYLKNSEYNQLKSELYKLQMQVCRVASSVLDAGHYTVALKVADQKLSHKKLTIELTQYL